MLHRPAPLFLILGALLVADAHVITAFIPGFGLDLHLYNAAFVGLTIAALPALPLLARRRVASVGLAVTGTAVLASSVLLLYGREFHAVRQLMTWLRFWHAAWSWAFLVLLVAHVILNRVRLAGFTGFLARWPLAWSALLAFWVALLGLAVLSVTPRGLTLFPREAYVALVTGAVLALTGVMVLAWRGLRARAATRFADATAVTRATGLRKRRRVLVDAGLLIATVLTFATGFLVLYARQWLRMNGYLQVSLFWHSVASGLMIALLAVHVVTNGRPLTAHAWRVGREAAASSWSRADRP